jgi:formylglycine-generating enzyme required for sulfatase activity
MRPTDWLKRLDELSPRVAVALGCGVGLGFLLLPGTVLGAALGLLGMGGLFVLGMSGRTLLVSVPRELPQAVPVAQDQPAEVSLVQPPTVRSPIRLPVGETWLVAEGVAFTMRPLNGGEFWMGSRDDDEQAYESEKPRHRVRVSPFSMMMVGVTQRLYRSVMKQEPPDEAEAELPVTGVSWFDAVAFCNALSELRGLRPCYQQTENGWEWDRSADGFRLPTEAEREYATRAGSEDRWCFGDDEAKLGDYAWFAGNGGGSLHPVGQKTANAWGLHDLHGNVWEWCWDWFGPYSAESAIDPLGANDGNERMLRGGSFLVEPWLLRSASRDWSGPVDLSWFFGFRCVRSVSRQP